MIGLLGKKIGTTRIYDGEGNIRQVTVVLAGPNRVVQCKTEATDGYNAIQLGFDDQLPQRLSKPAQGHLAKHGSEPVRRIREFRDFSLDVKPGDILGPQIFSAGDYVDAIGVTKGRGFAGVMKRHNFRGGWASHGSKGFRRRPGSIAPGSTPGWVAKGKKMPGHMGQVRRTVQNLQILGVREEDNVLLISGSVPGANGDYVVIRESKKNPKAAK